jgi:hypothetical protein
MTQKLGEVKELTAYDGKAQKFVAVSKNAYVTCGADGKPIFDRGEIEIAKLFGFEFPDMETRVSIGPWRCWDITGDISADHKVIFIDIYSVRCPSTKHDYITDLITNAHRILDGKKLTPEQSFKE